MELELDSSSKQGSSSLVVPIVVNWYSCMLSSSLVTPSMGMVVADLAASAYDLGPDFLFGHS